MPANTSPIYSLAGTITAVVPSAANVKSDGAGTIGTDLFIVKTGAANGSFVSKIRFSPFASAAATNTAATTLRVFICNTNTGAVTSATCFLIGELSAAIQAADHSTNSTFYLEIPLNFVLPNGYTLLVSTHVASAANTGWQAVCFAGDY